LTPSLEVLKETIKRLIYKGNYKALERILEKSHTGDIASIFRYLSPQERLKTFQILMKINLQKASDVLYELDEDLQIEILRSLPIDDAVRILLTFSTGEIAEIIDKLPENVQKKLLSKLNEEEREEIQRYIEYGDTVASLISEDYVALNENKTVADALSVVKTAPSEIDVVYIYVVDDKNRLVGVITIKDLLNSPLSAQLRDIMNRDIISLRENTPKEEAIELFRRYEFFSLPVVDDEDVLKGVIYIDEILDLISEKTTEEFFKMAGAQEEELFYTNQVFKVAKLRLPWLLVSVIGELFTAIIISFFGDTIEKYLPIVFFLPLVAAVSGNISSQAAIITARGLMTGKFTQFPQDIITTILKELKVAFLIGIVISFLVGFISFLWLSNHILGIIVGTALLFNILVAALVGTILPFIIYKLNKDPAFATGPITLTITDIIGILIYLLVATVSIKSIIG
jgi:magnesium transporter